MKSIATTTLLLLVCIAGCQHSSASKISGRWDLVSHEEINRSNPADNDDSIEQTIENTEKMFNSIAGGETVGSMSLVFHRNGKLETFTDFPMASTGRPKVGTWKFKSWDEAKQVIVIECDLFDEKTTTSIRFLDDNTIELVPPNLAVLETNLRFRRRQ